MNAAVYLLLIFLFIPLGLYCHLNEHLLNATFFVYVALYCKVQQREMLNLIFLFRCTSYASLAMYYSSPLSCCTDRSQLRWLIGKLNSYLVSTEIASRTRFLVVPRTDTVFTTQKEYLEALNHFSC